MIHAFPLIRHLSKPLSKTLKDLPITPNQITTASLFNGLIGCAFFISPEFIHKFIGSLLFLTAYVLDNCDGEVARHKNLTSEFGEKYDTFVDWIVHACFFSALGFGVAHETNNILWLWLGLAGGLGGTINYFISVFSVDSNNNEDTEENSQPTNFKEYTIYIFRELFRADFCFIVLALSLVDLVWILVPAGAIGAQVYWVMFFMSRNKKYHV